MNDTSQTKRPCRNTHHLKSPRFDIENQSDDELAASEIQKTQKLISLEPKTAKRAAVKCSKIASKKPKLAHSIRLSGAQRVSECELNDLKNETLSTTSDMGINDCKGKGQ